MAAARVDAAAQVVQPGAGELQLTAWRWRRSGLEAGQPGSDKLLGYGLRLALVWYFSVLVWRLRRGTAGVRPIEELTDR